MQLIELAYLTEPRVLWRAWCCKVCAVWWNLLAAFCLSNARDENADCFISTTGLPRSIEPAAITVARLEERRVLFLDELVETILLLLILLGLLGLGHHLAHLLHQACQVRVAGLGGRLRLLSC